MVFGNMLSQRFGSDRRGADGVRVDNFQGFSTLGILDEIQKMMTKSMCEPEQFKGRIILMSMYNDIDLGHSYCECSLSYWECSKIHARTLVVSGAWTREEMVRNPCPQTWWRIGQTCWGHDAQHSESRHLVFCAASALERGELKSEGKGMKTIHYFNGSDGTIELILRTIIPANQLSVYGAVADLCGEVARDSRGTGKPAANENLESMVIPTEFLTANLISQTDAEAQGNVLREYEQNFAELPEQQKLTKLSSDAGFSKNIERGQIFITHDDDALDDLKGSCREYTLPRSEETSRVRGWIRGNTEIGPVLDVKVCYHQGRYGVEIMIESLFRDRTVSWVRIVNGINKFVTETSEEILVASVGTGKPVARAKPRPKPTLTLSLVSLPLSRAKMDRYVLNHENSAQVVLKCQNSWSDYCDMTIQFIESMIEHKDLKIWQNLSQGKPVLGTGQFKLGSASWQKEEDKRKGFSTAWTLILRNISCIFEQSRDTQEVLSLILHFETMHRCRMTSPSTSTTSGTLTTCTPSRADWFREESLKSDRQSVFFTAVNPMYPSASRRSSIRSRKTQNRGLQEHLENTTKSCRLVQFETGSEERIQRNRSFQHFTCDMYWESGKHEDWKRIPPIPKVTASRTHAEFASWTSGSV